MEIWKDIQGYEGKYQVSSEGRVRSVACLNSRGRRVQERIRRFCHNRNGYLYVNLCKDGKPDISGKRHFNYGRRGANAKTHKGRVIGISKTNPSDIVEFETASVAARTLGISSGQLCDAINGKAKSCGGYYWRRLNG